MARRKQQQTTALARPGDPLVMADGTVLEEDVEQELEQPKQRITAQQFKPSKRRSVQDLPAPTGVINAVATVFMYSVLGLSEREIAEALNIESSQVKHIKKHSAYTECFDLVLNEFLSANSDLLQSRIAAHMHTAFDGVLDIAQRGKQENNRLRANIDILDRGGARPQDNVNRRASSGNELRIVIVDDDKSVNVEVNGENV